MLDLEKLNYEERATYTNLIKQKESLGKISSDDLADAVRDNLYIVIRELVETSNKETEKNTSLKARAKNYLLLMDLLSAPNKRLKQLEKALADMENKLKS